MRPEDLHEILAAVKAGTLDIDLALEALRTLPFADLGFAKVDHHRELRTGFPEVIYGPGKTAEQVVGIAASLVRSHGRMLATRIEPALAAAVLLELPALTYHPLARVLTHGYVESDPQLAQVAVLTAGTADMPVAEEAALTAEMHGARVLRVYDVGVAGIHRLLHQRDRLESAKVLITVAGMEGALPSVVGGLFSKPVIAVPTSVGYGASFGGIAALLAMLNSCVAGVSVVNIDNGFGAGYLAGLLVREGLGSSAG